MIQTENLPNFLSLLISYLQIYRAVFAGILSKKILLNYYEDRRN